jgi:hypothetical protein
MRSASEGSAASFVLISASLSAGNVHRQLLEINRLLDRVLAVFVEMIVGDLLSAVEVSFVDRLLRGLSIQRD